MITAQLEFLKSANPKPSYIMQGFGEEPISIGIYWRKDVNITDARESADSFTLNSHGFQLVSSPTKLKTLDSSSAISDQYLPESIALVKHQLGATWVKAIDYTIRTSDPSVKQRGTAPRVHNDYTPASALLQFQRQLGADFDAATAGRRLLQVNLWRPFTEPVIVKPLAIADGRSIKPEHLIPCDVIYPERCGENFEVMHDTEQHWYYFSNMHNHEAVMIKGFDSDTEAQVRFTPHSSFSHPDTPADAPARWSIEVRTLVIL